MNIIILQFLLTAFFVTIIFLHIIKKNFSAVILYSIQSLIVVLLLIMSYFETGAVSLLIVALITFITKMVLAPMFFIKLIKKYNLKFLLNKYINLPVTLIIVAILTFFSHSKVFEPLINNIPANGQFISLALSALFISFFLIINSKGAISQIISVLSFENSIVIFAFFAGLEQTLTLQIGILFDIFIWIIIATVFISMLYKHFGSFDVTKMTELKD